MDGRGQEGERRVQAWVVPMRVSIGEVASPSHAFLHEQDGLGAVQNQECTSVPQVLSAGEVLGPGEATHPSQTSCISESMPSKPSCMKRGAAPCSESVRREGGLRASHACEGDVRDRGSHSQDSGVNPTEWQAVRECPNGAQPLQAPSLHTFGGRHDSLEVGQYNFTANKVHVQGVKFSKVHVPANLKEAQRSEQWRQWEQAMQEEKDSLDAHDTMEYVERPHGHKVIPVHWIFSTKVDEHGNVLRFKARLVAQGCRQVPGIDVGEVFPPLVVLGLGELSWQWQLQRTLRFTR